MNGKLAELKRVIESETESALADDEVAIMERINTLADLKSIGPTLADDGTGRYAALLADIGAALGLPRDQANTLADSFFRPANRLPAAQPVEPVFAIGGIGRGDGAEQPAPWPKQGEVCRKCGASASDGAMFTTIAGSGICDDCI